MKRIALRDTKKSIVLFVLLFVSYAIIYMTKNCYAAAMSSIVEDGVMTASETGLISAVFYLIYAVFQLVGGFVSDRLPPQWMIFIGTVGAGASNLLIFFFSDSYGAMMAIWSVNAALQFGIWPSIFRIVSTQLKESHRPRGIFLIMTASSLGLVFSYICAALIEGWRYNFLVSAIALFAVSLVFILVYESLKRSMLPEEGSDEEKAVTARPAELSGGGVPKLLFISGIPLLAIVNVIHSVISLGIKSIAPTMISTSYPEVTSSIATLLNIIPVIFSTVGIILSYIPKIRRASPPLMMGIFLGASIPPVFVITLVGRLHVAFIVAAIALTMVATGIVSVLFSYISKSFVKFGCVATVTGIFNCMASLGIFVSNYVLLKIAESSEGGWASAMWVTLILLVAALFLSVASVFIWRSFKRRAGI